jgi:hypothetical protein
MDATTREAAASTRGMDRLLSWGVILIEAKHAPALA